MCLGPRDDGRGCCGRRNREHEDAGCSVADCSGSVYVYCHGKHHQPQSVCYEHAREYVSGTVVAVRVVCSCCLVSARRECY
jgi:hypothetical protein